MADDISVAFEAPHTRAAATANGEMLDRISVRDYVKEVEIGAFQSERGVTQRVRFNVVLEVGHTTAAQDDDVDKVLSYDTIVEAIEEQLSTERINLLETLAERIAERCLDDRRAVRVFVRIEKLDRIPGTLGVEIARARVELGTGGVTPLVERPEPEPDTDNSQIVVFLKNAVLASDDLTAWLDGIAALDQPAVIALEPIDDGLTHDNPMVNRRLELLSIEQNAWVLAGHDPRCVVVSSRTELEHAAKTNQMSVWAPSKIVLDAVDKPGMDTDSPADLIHWFAQEIGATALVLPHGCAVQAGSDMPIHSVRTPADLAEMGR